VPSEPLRIDAVDLPGMGSVGLTFCPGKTDPHGSAGPHHRDLGKDIRAIAEWGAEHLVTLIQPHEFSLLEVDGLGEAAEMAGLDWSWLPIPDGGIPDREFHRRWQYAGERLRRVVRKGGRVVVHCRGGLGRAGLVASQLLVELGLEPDAALGRIRRARPGAVETAPQETYLHALATGAVPDPTNEAFLAVLFGGAVGDALGYPVEFWSRKGIQENFGPMGITMPRCDRQGRLVVSDDTQMTLFTLAGLLEARAVTAGDGDAAVAGVSRAYQAWLQTQEGTPTPVADGPIDQLATAASMQYQRAPGRTCLQALRDGDDGTPEFPVNDSKGCGGVMRVAPVGLVGSWSPETAYEIGARTAALTHGHPAGYAAAGAMAALVRLLRSGQGLAESGLDVLHLLALKQEGLEVRLALQQALERAQISSNDPIADVVALGEGWVAEEALAIGVFAALRSRDYPDALRIAASHGGDSDSTASIAGQLYGAWQGLASIPHAWIRRLDVLDPLLALVASEPEKGGAGRGPSGPFDERLTAQRPPAR